MASFSGTKIILTGSFPVLITAAEDLEAGDLITATGYKADADAADRQAELVASKATSSGNDLIAFRMAHISGISGGAGAGTKLYLSDTSGDAAETPSTTYYQQIGFELSATTALFCPGVGASAGNWRKVGVSGTPVAYSGDEFAEWYLDDASTTGEKAALKVFVTNSAIRTAGRVTGLIIEAEAVASKDVYSIRGANISVYMNTGATATGSVFGLHVEAQGGATLGGDYYGLYVYYAPGANPAGSCAVARFEQNAASPAYCDAFLELTGDATAALSFGPNATATSWGYTGSPSVAGGWIKVKVGTYTRYIYLYTTAPA